MENNKGLAVFGGCMLVLLLIPVSTILNGFVLMKIWNWFMPYIEVVKINIPVAIGISCIPSLFRNMRLKEKEMKISESLTSILVAPLFLLAFAYVITLFL